MSTSNRSIFSTGPYHKPQYDRCLTFVERGVDAATTQWNNFITALNAFDELPQNVIRSFMIDDDETNEEDNDTTMPSSLFIPYKAMKDDVVPVGTYLSYINSGIDDQGEDYQNEIHYARLNWFCSTDITTQTPYPRITALLNDINNAILSLDQTKSDYLQRKKFIIQFTEYILCLYLFLFRIALPWYCEIDIEQFVERTCTMYGSSDAKRLLNVELFTKGKIRFKNGNYLFATDVGCKLLLFPLDDPNYKTTTWSIATTTTKQVYNNPSIENIPRPFTVLNIVFDLILHGRPPCGKPSKNNPNNVFNPDHDDANIVKVYGFVVYDILEAIVQFSDYTDHPIALALVHRYGLYDIMLKQIGKVVKMMKLENNKLQSFTQPDVLKQVLELREKHSSEYQAWLVNTDEDTKDVVKNEFTFFTRFYESTLYDNTTRHLFYITLLFYKISESFREQFISKDWAEIDATILSLETDATLDDLLASLEAGNKETKKDDDDDDMDPELKALLASLDDIGKENDNPTSVDAELDALLASLNDYPTNHEDEMDPELKALLDSLNVDTASQTSTTSTTSTQSNKSTKSNSSGTGLQFLYPTLPDEDGVAVTTPTNNDPIITFDYPTLPDEDGYSAAPQSQLARKSLPSAPPPPPQLAHKSLPSAPPPPPPSAHAGLREKPVALSGKSDAMAALAELKKLKEINQVQLSSETTPTTSNTPTNDAKANTGGFGSLYTPDPRDQTVKPLTDEKDKKNSQIANARAEMMALRASLGVNCPNSTDYSPQPRDVGVDDPLSITTSSAVTCSPLDNSDDSDDSDNSANDDESAEEFSGENFGNESKPTNKQFAEYSLNPLQRQYYFEKHIKSTILVSKLTFLHCRRYNLDYFNDDSLNMHHVARTDNYGGLYGIIDFILARCVRPGGFVNNLVLFTALFNDDKENKLDHSLTDEEIKAELDASSAVGEVYRGQDIPSYDQERKPMPLTKQFDNFINFEYGLTSDSTEHLFAIEKEQEEMVKNELENPCENFSHSFFDLLMSYALGRTNVRISRSGNNVGNNPQLDGASSKFIRLVADIFISSYQPMHMVYEKMYLSILQYFLKSQWFTLIEHNQLSWATPHLMQKEYPGLDLYRGYSHHDSNQDYANGYSLITMPIISLTSDVVDSYWNTQPYKNRFLGNNRIGNLLTENQLPFKLERLSAVYNNFRALNQARLDNYSENLDYSSRPHLSLSYGPLHVLNNTQLKLMYRSQFKYMMSWLYGTNTMQITTYLTQRLYWVQKISLIKQRYIKELFYNAKMNQELVDDGGLFDLLGPNHEAFQNAEDLSLPLYQSYNYQHMLIMYTKNSITKEDDEFVELEQPLYAKSSLQHSYESPYMLAQGHNLLYGRRHVCRSTELNYPTGFDQRFQYFYQYILYVASMMSAKVDLLAELPLHKSFMITMNHFNIPRAFLFRFFQSLNWWATSHTNEVDVIYLLDHIYRIGNNRLLAAVPKEITSKDKWTENELQQSEMLKANTFQYIEVLAAIVQGCSNSSFSLPYDSEYRTFLMQYYPFIDQQTGKEFLNTEDGWFDEEEHQILDSYPEMLYANPRELIGTFKYNSHALYSVLKDLQHPFLKIANLFPSYSSERSKKIGIYGERNNPIQLSGQTIVQFDLLPVGEKLDVNNTIPMFLDQCAFHVQLAIESMVELLLLTNKEPVLQDIIFNQMDLSNSMDLPVFTAAEDGLVSQDLVIESPFSDEQTNLINITSENAHDVLYTPFPKGSHMKVPMKQQHFGFYSPVNEHTRTKRSKTIDNFNNPFDSPSFQPFTATKAADGKTTTVVMNDAIDTFTKERIPQPFKLIVTDHDNRDSNSSEFQHLDRIVQQVNDELASFL